MRYLVHIYCIDFVNVWMFAGIFSCTPSFSPEINKVYLILSYLILLIFYPIRSNVSSVWFTEPFLCGQRVLLYRCILGWYTLIFYLIHSNVSSVWFTEPFLCVQRVLLHRCILGWYTLIFYPIRSNVSSVWFTEPLSLCAEGPATQMYPRMIHIDILPYT